MQRWRGPARLAAFAAGICAVGAASAQEPTPPAAKPADPTKLAREIWPFGLKTLEGRFVFAQVASPGGLYERVEPKKPGPSTSRQIAVSHLPEALKRLIERAELTIGPLEAELETHAEKRESPSKRGFLRFMTERGFGQLVMSTIPGVGDDDLKGQSFRGRVEFTLEHTSHSNPSNSGIFLLRQQQERTWGAATLDYADLNAGFAPLPAPAPAAPPAAGKPQTPAASPKKPAGPQADPDNERILINNCRVLRSGHELVLYISWRQEQGDRTTEISGSIRLIRDSQRGPQGQPGGLKPTPAAPVTGRSA